MGFPNLRDVSSGVGRWRRTGRRLPRRVAEDFADPGQPSGMDAWAYTAPTRTTKSAKESSILTSVWAIGRDATLTIAAIATAMSVLMVTCRYSADRHDGYVGELRSTLAEVNIDLNKLSALMKSDELIYRVAHEIVFSQYALAIDSYYADYERGDLAQYESPLDYYHGLDTRRSIAQGEAIGEPAVYTETLTKIVTLISVYRYDQPIMYTALMRSLSLLSLDIQFLHTIMVGELEAQMSADQIEYFLGAVDFKGKMTERLIESAAGHRDGLMAVSYYRTVELAQLVAIAYLSSHPRYLQKKEARSELTMDTIEDIIRRRFDATIETLRGLVDDGLGDIFSDAEEEWYLRSIDLIASWRSWPGYEEAICPLC